MPTEFSRSLKIRFCSVCRWRPRRKSSGHWLDWVYRFASFTSGWRASVIPRNCTQCKHSVVVKKSRFYRRKSFAEGNSSRAFFTISGVGKEGGNEIHLVSNTICLKFLIFHDLGRPFLGALCSHFSLGQITNVYQPWLTFKFISNSIS